MINRKITIFLTITCLIMAMLVSVSFAQKNIVLSGGSIGSVANLGAVAVGSIAQKYCNMSPTVVSNPTTAQVDCLHNRDVDIAIATGYLTYDAYNGFGKWEGKPYKDIRCLLDRPNSQLQLVVPYNSPIRKIRDVVGKTIAFNKPGSTSAVFGKLMFEALGIFDDFKSIQIGYRDAAALIKSNKADAMFVTGTFPHPTLAEITESMPGGIRIISISEEDINTIIEKYPQFVPTEIPSGAYKGMDETISTVEYVNVFACVDLSEEEAYCITKHFWENQDFVALQWAALSRLKLEDIGSMKRLAPWHIGAYKYYKEVGLEIPPDMIPPEAK